MNITEKKLIALASRPHFSLAERHTVTDPFVHLRTFLTALGNPENKIPHYIQITGTSGKGSTAGYIASILKTSGARTGLTVSPHLQNMRERWQINGVPISNSEFDGLVKKLTNVFNDCAALNPKFGLSFFELCTTLSLLYFSKHNVEWAVLEVFSGGRVDPTNIIPRKDAAIITTIGLDHQHLLGNTKIKIAREKSGIIIPGTQVFTSEQNLKIKTLIARIAAKQSAKLVHVLQPKNIKLSVTGTHFTIGRDTYQVSALGAHQARNAALAISVAKTLRIKTSLIKKGLAQTILHNRVEVVAKKPLIILDSAHNPDKIAATVATIKNVFKQSSHLHLLVELRPHKDIKEIVKKLALLRPTHCILTTSTTNTFSPGLTLDTALQTAQKFLPKTTIQAIPNPKKAWKTLTKQVQKTDVLLITGSTYLAGQVNSFLSKK